MISLLGNVIWFLAGGALTALSWVFYGILWSITVVGLPIGIQCFKYAVLSACPFGVEVMPTLNVGSMIPNVIWMLVTGIPMAFEHLVLGLVLCVTIVGIPFGLQHFKLARLALMPFGTILV